MPVQCGKIHRRRSCRCGPSEAPLLTSHLSRAKSRHKISQGETSMTIFDPARTRVIDAGGPGGGILRLIGLGIIAFVLVILLFSSVTRVGTGHVGVLTLFGRVTNETLGEGIHLINPLKTNNEMSIQTQTLKESASVPSSEGLMMSLDTSLIYHLTPDRAAEVFQDRKRTRLNSSHVEISYAVFCLKKKKPAANAPDPVDTEQRPPGHQPE